jgi:hypothetical protein
MDGQALRHLRSRGGRPARWATLGPDVETGKGPTVLHTDERSGQDDLNAPPATSEPSPRIAWSWDRALVGVAYALPAAVVTLQDPTVGIPLAIGVLPAAILPVPARRADRIIILVVGALAGLSLFVGGIVSQLPTIAAAIALGVLVVVAAAATRVVPSARIILTLGVPLLAAGLSYDDLATSALAFVLLSVGAAYAWLVALVLPPRDAEHRAAPPAPATLGYGIRLGAAAAIAYVITGTLGVDHPGWAPAACLLVARPQLDLLQTRGVSRVAAVFIGATAAGLAVNLGLAPIAYASLIGAVLGAASGTTGSRWYISSAFSTFLVFLVMLAGQPQDLRSTFDLRVGETVLGVALAYLFVWVLPTLAQRFREPRR